MGIAPLSGSLPARSLRGERDTLFVASNRLFRFGQGNKVHSPKSFNRQRRNLWSPAGRGCVRSSGQLDSLSPGRFLPSLSDAHIHALSAEWLTSVRRLESGLHAAEPYPRV